MKRLVSCVLIYSVYLGLIAPIVLQSNLQANAQTARGRTRQTNMNLDSPNCLRFRLSEGEAGAEKREKQPPPQTNPLSES